MTSKQTFRQAMATYRAYQQGGKVDADLRKTWKAQVHAAVAEQAIERVGRQQPPHGAGGKP